MGAPDRIRVGGAKYAPAFYRRSFENMGKKLVIAEKPSVAGDLARALGKFQREKDFFENDEYVISSAVGHLLELKAPEGVEVKRGKWQLENLPVLPQEFELQPIEKTESRLNLLKRLIKRKDVDELINACDAGREGELIFRNLVRASGAKKPISRLWLQSMTPESIRHAFANLRSDEELRPLADAAISRSESDWLVGINSTRALTAFNSRLVGGFQKTTAGRVQTPTLAILVEREEKIRTFKVRPYFEVYADFKVASGSYRGRWYDEKFKKNGDEDARSERIWERPTADEILAKCLHKLGTITEERKPTSQIPPQLYDLTTLQREANSRFGFSAVRTLQLAQQLYEREKVLTYPRTDSRYLPEDYIGNVKSVMTRIEDPSLAKHAGKALDSGWIRPNPRVFDNKKVSDHFAIIPTGHVPTNLDEAQQKIYDMVTRRFIAVFFPAARFEVTTRVTRVEGEAFKTEGKIIVDPGWLAVYGRETTGESEADKVLVAVAPGEEGFAEQIEVKECQTKPPARFTEATLLSAMEGAGKLIEDEELREAMREKGLGTPATRASIIEGLIFEGYIERRQRDLVATAKGISLITLLRNLNAEVLCKPQLTGEWESRLKQIEHGKLARGEFMHGIRGLTSELVDKVKGFREDSITGIFPTIEATCPKCGGGPFKGDYLAYTCAGCGLRIWKSIAGRELEPEEVRHLLTDGVVGPLEGFVSKMGRKFAARIKLNAEHKTEFLFDDSPASEAKEPEDLSQCPVVADCPVCKKGRVYETEKAFVCENARKTGGSAKPACNLRIGRVILQKQVPAEQVAKLLTTGKTDLIPKFISKKGRPFSAFLILEKSGKVTFEFEPRKPAKAKVAEKEG
jgi:DNA topoisomerase-3